MQDIETGWPVAIAFAGKVKALEIAAHDLSADDVDSDELIDFYVQAHTQALRDVLLLSTNCPRHVLLKMALIKEHGIFDWNAVDFDEIWNAIVRDLKLIAELSSTTRCQNLLR